MEIDLFWRSQPGSFCTQDCRGLSRNSQFARSLTLQLQSQPCTKSMSMYYSTSQTQYLTLLHYQKSKLRKTQSPPRPKVRSRVHTDEHTDLIKQAHPLNTRYKTCQSKKPIQCLLPSRPNTLFKGIFFIASNKHLDDV